MSALLTKLFRDLRHLSAQVLAVSAVVFCGVATLVTMQSVLASLEYTTNEYYREHRFADLFATVRQAPISCLKQLQRIEGVELVEGRVVTDARVNLRDLSEPATAKFVGLPKDHAPHLNSLYIRRGRYPVSTSPEVIVSEAFMSANQLELGDSITAILNGRLQTFRIVGIGLSPEFVYEVPVGALFPDNRHFGIIWANEEMLATALDIPDAYNDFVFRAEAGVPLAAVKRSIDRVLARYGSLGAIDRGEQTSARFLTEEMKQYTGTSVVIPFLFLAVSAFLLHIVLSRLIATQRDQIAILKAFGYSNRAIGLHYLEFAVMMVMPGILIGVASGIWFGMNLMDVYTEYFRFPKLVYHLPPYVIAVAAGVTLVAAALGVARVVWQAVALPPAVAMQPDAPAAYHPGLLERLRLTRLLNITTRLTVRDIERRPVRTALSIATISFAIALLMVGQFMIDGVILMMNVEFNEAQHQNVTVSFRHGRPLRTVHDLKRIPGVLLAEPERLLGVRLRSTTAEKLVLLEALPRGAHLRELVDADSRRHNVTPGGITLASQLADMLRVNVGDTVWLRVEGWAKPAVPVRVADTVGQLIGLAAYSELNYLSRITNEDVAVSRALLMTDPSRSATVLTTLKRMPEVSEAVLRSEVKRTYDKLIQQNLRVSTITITLFAAILAFGVVYNSGRIALSERARDLMSLRVLGFTKGEVLSLLLGQQFIITVLSLPVGLFIGYRLCLLVPGMMDTELYRMPVIFTVKTLAFSVLVVLVSSILSSLLVARRVRALSIVDVLKTRE